MIRINKIFYLTEVRSNCIALLKLKKSIVVAARHSKPSNGFCPVARYTKTLFFGQNDCQMSIYLHSIFPAGLRIRYKS